MLGNLLYHDDVYNSYTNISEELIRQITMQETYWAERVLERSTKRGLKTVSKFTAPVFTVAPEIVENADYESPKQSTVIWLELLKEA